ncbi:STAS domain-containing protein [Fictibacillus phosphorivorans]|uniref:STAS domain-containing protein n=1 Tax=Fictibacillus phosphorivorans TaxID=1221500 RepID=UPI00203AAFCA|nr:STAS domain-containing protein [Fictibacillus phosphorivorans]MCM3719392.1 STAS domain-containing protein [Fictibacillus phosphorivorans]MCM3777130.1 STAS domain-containing protein [Fictibacillus phosphorivorans]
MSSALPVPYVKINKDGLIQCMSQKAIELLPEHVKIIQDCFDGESHNKLAKYLFPFEGEKSFEANVNGKDNPFVLCDIHISWEGENAHVVFNPIGTHVKGLEEKLSELRLRLASTDFELFEKKEALEEAMKRLDELSGPFIPISEKMAFVPLFGDITESKMMTVTGNALKAAYEGQFEDIFFDLSATGEIDEPGVQKLSELFRMLHYMNGKPVSIIGIKPKHARQLHKLDVDWPVYYETSLKEVLLQQS